jgi:hypothetical protein
MDDTVTPATSTTTASIWLTENVTSFMNVTKCELSLKTGKNTFRTEGTEKMSYAQLTALVNSH